MTLTSTPTSSTPASTAASTAASTLPLAADPTSPPDTTARSAALWAGLGYVALFVLAIFANFAVLTRFVDPDDPVGTVESIVANESLVRLALVAFSVVFVIDIVVAWALYLVFRPVGARRSLLAAWLRLGYTVLLGAAVTFLYLALQVATGGAAGGSMDEAGRATWTALLLDGFDITWLVGLMAFGCHLLVIGWLIVRSRIAPRLLGLVLMVAGTAYIADTIVHLALVDYAAYADVMLPIVAIPSVIGELSFAVWLLVRASGRRRG